jgi:hypothetical protein
LELYYLHFFGEGGGPVFLKAKDNELFVDVVHVGARELIRKVLAK